MPSEEPKAFLCHASEDKDLARRIAKDLQNDGIDTFFDEWEIRSGDSIRRKIDSGLENCTHFIALLTPTSIHKPWVNEEMDAAFVKKVEGQCRFIPLRHELSTSDLPPLLRGISSPGLVNYEEDLRRLVSDIYGVARKPPLGTAPAFTQRPEGLSSDLSTAAARIAELMIRRSENGVLGDPDLNVDDLRTMLQMPDDDIQDGVEELEDLGLVRPIRAMNCGPIGFKTVWPEDELFVCLDGQLMSWDPEADAFQIAADLINDEEGSALVQDVAERYGWPPRRINPAVNYLISDDLVDSDETMGSQPYTRHWIRKTSRTRRFVRDHS